MDNLINSITSTSDSGITLTLSMAIVAMAAALIFGLVISLTYMATLSASTSIVRLFFCSSGVNSVDFSLRILCSLACAISCISVFNC